MKFWVNIVNSECRSLMATVDAHAAALEEEE